MRTTAGLDWLAALMGSAAGSPASYMGLSQNTTAPAAGDTTLTGEMSNSGGGLNRKQASYMHTPGVNSYTETATYTMNSSDGSSAAIAKMAMFIGQGAVTMPFENLITPTANLAPNDSVTVTETVNLP